MFLDDQEGGSDARIEMEELPTGVVTYLTKCYTPCCVDGQPCYAYSCPRRVSTVSTPGNSMVCLGDFCCQGQSASILSSPAVEVPAPRTVRACGCPVSSRVGDRSYLSLQSVEWQEGVPPEILASLPESEVRRQTYDIWHWRSLLLNPRYLGLSVRSSRRNNSTSKTWTSSKKYVTDRVVYQVTHSHISVRFSFALYETQTLLSSEAALMTSSRKCLVISLTCASVTETYSRLCMFDNESKVRLFRRSGIYSSMRPPSSVWHIPRTWGSCRGRRRD